MTYARTALKNNNREEALRWLGEELKVRPDNTEAILLSGNLWVELKKYDMAKNCFRRACELDPDNAEFYCRNTDEYVAELTELDNSFRETVAGSKRNLLIFGDRFPLLYFVREYGLDYYAAFPGCAAETEPSAATVAFLIDAVKREKVPVVLYIELSNHKVADAIAESAGVRTAQFNTCHNISADDFAAGESYLSLMTANADILREALN